MAKNGITKDQVFAAAEAMVKKGDDVTVKAVREYLGSGSMTTISKYLGLWKKGEGEEMVSSSPCTFDIAGAFGDLSIEIIAEFLSNEHPQIIALILSHFDSSKAARVLECYESEKAANIIKRIEKLVPVTHRTLSRIDKVIRSEMKYFEEIADTKTGGVEFAKKLKSELKGVAREK